MYSQLIVKYSKHKEIINGFAWRALQIVCKQGISFLIFLLCARSLGLEEFGTYSYLLSIIFTLAMVSDFGISVATSKYVAEYNLTNKENLRAVLFNSVIVVTAITCFVALLFLSFAKSYLGDMYLYSLLLLPMLVCVPLTSIYDGIYRGLKNFRVLAIVYAVVSIVSLVFIYIAVTTYGLVGALLAQSAFYIILLLALASTYRDFSFKFNKIVIKDIGKYGIYIGFGILGYYLFSRVDVLILGHYGYVKEIATYELLNKFFMICLLPMQVLAQVVFPYFAEISANNDYKKIMSKFKKYAVASFCISLVFIAFSYFSMPYVVNVFFPKFYNEIFFDLIIFVILIYAIQIYGVVIHTGILSATGYAHLMMYLNLLLGPLNLLLGIFLITHLGYIGVIYSNLILNLIGVIVLQSMFLYLIKKKIQNNFEHA